MADTNEANDTIFVTDLPKGLEKETLKVGFEPYGTIVWSNLMPGQGKLAALIQYSTVEEASYVVENLSGSIIYEGSTPVTIRYAKPRGSGTRKGGAGGKAGRWTPYGNVESAGGCAGYAAMAGAYTGGCGKGGGGGKGKDSTSVAMLKKDLQAAGKLPGGKGYTNDDGAIFVGGLPWDTTNEDVYQIFAPFGAIPPRGVKAMTKPDGRCSGIAFVNYLDAEHAQVAIEALNGATLRDGTALRVKVKTPKGTPAEAAAEEAAAAVPPE